MSLIDAVRAREILDSRGNPTIEADVWLDDGASGRAAVPSGASTGEHEALELRDGDPSRFGGKGVLRAVANVHDAIAPALEGMDAYEQRSIDRTLVELDGTDDRSGLGANAMLAVSLATARAAADSQGMPLWRSLGGPNAHVLPTPMLNVINGGAHADNELELQEFMVMPVGAASFSEAIRWGATCFHALRGILHDKGLSTAVGDEGGFAPSCRPAPRPSSCCSGRSRPGSSRAARSRSRWTRPRRSSRRTADATGSRAPTATDDMIEFWSNLLDRFPIVSIEDPLGEDDWEGWAGSSRRSALGRRSSATTCS